MGERKVLNKYYPPDFDPAKIPRRRQPKNQQIESRMMLPMSIRCNTCGNYIYKGTKFNSRKEDVVGQTYLGIQILRFYFKCSRCSAELTMMTDPQNSDYVMETGATRNFEPWRAADEALDDAKKKRDAEELGDAMKALENRTLDSKQEMDIMAALDEMKSMRARHAGVGTTEMLEALRRTAEVKEKELAEEDEVLLRAVVFQKSQKFFCMLDDEEFEDDLEYDDEEGLQQQEKKRRKGEAVGGNDDDKGKGPLVAVNTLVEHLPGTNTQSELLDKRKPSVPKAPFAIRPKPVIFSIKPKVSIGSYGERGAILVNPKDTGLGESLKNVSRTVMVPPENENGDANAPSLGLAALCSTYDSSDSD